jgi:uncharacterized protein YbaA (DUF1428 family)
MGHGHSVERALNMAETPMPFDGQGRIHGGFDFILGDPAV